MYRAEKRNQRVLATTEEPSFRLNVAFDKDFISYTMFYTDYADANGANRLSDR